MSDRKRLWLLLVIMTAVSLVVVAITILLLYNTAFEEERARLVVTAQSQARLIEAVARFDAAHEKVDPGSFPKGSSSATLSQIIDAHKHYKGFGETGEFTLARRVGDHIVFLLRHRHYDLDQPKPIPFDSNLAEPMQCALYGQSGTLVGLDYRGMKVLAAYEPVAELNLGIVAKIDLAEIRAPFIKAGVIAICVAFLVVLTGAALFLRISNPMIRRLEESAAELSSAIAQLEREIEERKRAEEALHHAHDELEQRVEKRTVELRSANTQLSQEIEERELAEEEQALLRRRLEALWEIASMTEASHQELCDRVLNEIIDMTHSQYAFYGFFNESENVMTLYSWSREALASCQVIEQPLHFPIAKAGLWADAARERRRLIMTIRKTIRARRVSLRVTFHSAEYYRFPFSVTAVSSHLQPSPIKPQIIRRRMPGKSMHSPLMCRS